MSFASWRSRKNKDDDENADEDVDETKKIHMNLKSEFYERKTRYIER